MATNLDNWVCTRLSPGTCSHTKDGICDRHTIFSTQGIKKSHGDAEEGHADGSTASATPQTPQQADPVHRCSGNLNNKYHLTESKLHKEKLHFFVREFFIKDMPIKTTKKSLLHHIWITSSPTDNISCFRYFFSNSNWLKKTKLNHYINKMNLAVLNSH